MNIQGTLKGIKISKIPYVYSDIIPQVYNSDEVKTLTCPRVAGSDTQPIRIKTASWYTDIVTRKLCIVFIYTIVKKKKKIPAISLL